MSKKNLIIVESPSKIKTLKKFLGEDYHIEASVGHFRDLPTKNLGIDLENNFTPKYVVSENSKKVVKNLKSVLKSMDAIYIATDPDREGEAIAWHLIDELKPKIPVRRMVFNEITKGAILDSLNNIRDIDLNLVNAQECRRFLDRLFGFLVSKELWYNVKGGLSAGRVQSPSVKILVDREKQRAKFVKSEYWSLQGHFKSNDGKIFSRLVSIDADKVAIGNSFNKETGELSAKNTVVLNSSQAEDLENALKDHDWKISDLEKKPQTQNPYPPFITSTLQQEGIRKLRMNSTQIMRVAQGLYESGYITYMRTDSINLSSEALQASRKVIKQKYGAEYLPDKPRVYKSKIKNAQEAHEAIRPAGSTFQDPSNLKNMLTDAEYKVYDLIWKRTVASQMNSAKIEQTKLQISDGKYIFRANGKTIIFPGFLRAYVEGADDPTADLDDMEKTLPKVAIGDSVTWDDIKSKQHFTKPISRFTEASLVKELEALGIGRPSTYATIMKKIQDKGYVNNVKGSLIPTFVGYGIVQFLERNFQDLVNLQYTSNMENELDNIALGQIKKEDYLQNFYYGSDSSTGLHNKLEQEHDKSLERLIHTITSDKKTTEIRIGRYGIYAQLGDDRVTLDDNIAPSEITIEQITKMLSDKNAAPEVLTTDTKTGSEIVLKKGRFGPYLQSGDKMKSLPPGISEDNLTPEIAQKVMLLPEKIGKDTKTNLPIIKDIGRYGPYLKCGKNNRKVSPPDEILSITLERAIELFATDAKQRSVLKNIGTSDDLEIVVKDGRYGIYVTNGKVNVTLPKDVDYNTLDLSTALELIKNKKPKKRFSKSK
jgi:DNA topoisomerase-1